MSNPMCYLVTLDIHMSNLVTCMSNLRMLFYLIIANFLTSGSLKNLKKHPKSYIQSWIFGSVVFSKFQHQLGHTYVQAGHTYVQVGHTYVQVGHTYVRSNNASTDVWKWPLPQVWSFNFFSRWVLAQSGKGPSNKYQNRNCPQLGWFKTHPLKHRSLYP